MGDIMRKLMLKKCSSCGAIVKVIKDCKCSCNFECCGKKLVDVDINSKDAAFEKHIPEYEVKDGKIIVKVNHVMESEHFIEWICFVNDEKEEYVYLNPNSDATATFNYSKGILYSYCNKHGLWGKEID